MVDSYSFANYSYVLVSLLINVIPIPILIFAYLRTGGCLDFMPFKWMGGTEWQLQVGWEVARTKLKILFGVDMTLRIIHKTSRCDYWAKEFSNWHWPGPCLKIGVLY